MVRLNSHDQREMDKAKDLIDTGPTTEMGFVRNLFFGRLRLDKVLPYPVQDEAEAKRTKSLLRKLDVFLDLSVNPDWIDRHQEIPDRVIRGLASLGVFGMTVPQEYGGGGFSHTGYCRALERISRTCASTAVLVGAHQSIGLKAIVLMGTEEQKQRFLPKLASGEELAAFALTEPEAGSDAANVQTTAVLEPGSDHWTLNGSKKFITNGALAKVMTVMARTPDPANPGRTKVTAFIVTPDLPGFEVVRPNRDKLGIRGTWQAELRFNNMYVPTDRVLGEVGKGLKVALGVLNYGRCTLSAGCLGAAKVLLEMAVRRATERKQFGRRLGDFQMIKQKIARIAQLTFAMESLTYLSAGMVDRHEDDMMLETAITKIFCSEALKEIADETLQIWGGEGYMADHGIERMWRDGRINTIVEGATEVMTSFVALMGMKGVGEEFEEVLHAITHPIGNMGRLAEFARHEWSDVLVGHHADGLHPSLHREGDELAHQTRSLARCVTRLLAGHREKIIDMQLLQKRIAWATINMYASTAVLARLNWMIGKAESNGGVEHIAQDLAVGTSFCHDAADRADRLLDDLFHNRDNETIAVADKVLGFDEEKADESHEGDEDDD
ncbi:MAG: acyl-CoA dehydrogenase [Phycisphaera sp.]|nr:acyl-CoA dehydrogenase [Phycisphaera sp.]